MLFNYLKSFSLFHLQQCLIDELVPILLAHSDHNVRTKCLIKIIFIIEMYLHLRYERSRLSDRPRSGLRTFDVGVDVSYKLSIQP